MLEAGRDGGKRGQQWKLDETVEYENTLIWVLRVRCVFFFFLPPFLLVRRDKRYPEKTLIWVVRVFFFPPLFSLFAEIRYLILFAPRGP